MAPSFVHSIDAAVAHYMLMRVGEGGGFIVSVHDAFGVHLRNVGKAARLFRDYLIELYGTGGFNPTEQLSDELRPIIDDKDYRKLVDKCLKSPHIIDGLI